MSEINTDNLSFEQANKLLEQSIEKLEKNVLPLEESIEEYAKACELIAFCVKKLDGYQGRIEEVNERLGQVKNGGY